MMPSLRSVDIVFKPTVLYHFTHYMGKHFLMPWNTFETGLWMSAQLLPPIWGLLVCSASVLPRVSTFLSSETHRHSVLRRASRWLHLSARAGVGMCAEASGELLGWTPMHTHTQPLYLLVTIILIRETRGGPLNLGTPQSTLALEVDKFTDHTTGQHNSVK